MSLKINSKIKSQKALYICRNNFGFVNNREWSRMTENVMIEVGQCGNQIGRRFWELALVEHAKAKTDPNYDLALSTFFRNVDSRSGRELKVGWGMVYLLWYPANIDDV